MKRLTAVDAEPRRSNQHEIGTTKAMRKQFLGEGGKRTFEATYIWLEDDREPLIEESSATYYDARERKPRPAEWRLYYPSNSVTVAMSEGDSLFLAMDSSGRLYFLAVQQGSTCEHQMSWLFNVQPRGHRFTSRGLMDDPTEIGFAARAILDQLGMEVQVLDEDRLEAIVGGFGTAFPTTAMFSKTARSTLPDVEPRDDPDAALLAWLDHEESMFRWLERRVVELRLKEGFADAKGVDVDGFISFSLSVQNRRKARMGQSLEHHVEAVFRAHELEFVRGAITENNHRPDFLF
ncbi:MAG: type II restriction endonuclease, partial [Acidobacteriota bacterium]|nr:type II restriction endonuclease [Acidobacteriota bacterium]